MHPTLQDIRYAVRLLTRTPAFTVIAVATLALGIGANTAIFTVVNALLIKPLPYGAPDRLVMVWQDYRARGGPQDEWATPGNYADWRQQKDLFEQVSVISGWRPILLGGAEPESLPGEQVSFEYFDVLGITPLAGRNFREQDGVLNAPRVAIISEGLWKRRFGGDPAVVGRVVDLSGERHEIVGIAPQGFRPIVASTAEVWRPRPINLANPSRGAITLRAVARLPRGLSLESAQAKATALAKQLEATYPQFNEKVGIYVQPLHDRVVGGFRDGLLALLGAVAFVLLIACANIANLLLARGSARSRELGIRLALGAARGRVIRQLLTESMLLAAIGGVAGMLLGVWAVDALVSIAPSNAPRVGEIRLDWSVFAFTAVVTMITGAICGLAPALQSSGGRVTQSLKESGRGTTAGSGLTLRRLLVVAEVALALILLTGGGLLVQTFVRLQKADLGFNPHNILVGGVNPPRATYDTVAKHRAFYDQVLEKASALPGVHKAALASVLPLGGDSDMGFLIEGRPTPTRTETPITWYRLVSANYFDVMGMRLRRGRWFADREAERVIVVNETLAARYFPGEDPLGRRIRFGADDPWFTIVGIAGDVRVRGARESTRVETFIPYWHITEPGMNVILKTATEPATLTAPLRQTTASIDRNVPVVGIRPFAEIVGDSIDQERFFAMLAAGFALLALLLAAIGTYGVMAYAVSQRTTEIGVRMALGATPRGVFRLVIGDGLKLTAAGVAVGTAGSLLLAKWLTTLLFGVQARDPLTLVGTAATLLVIAAAACFIPARRATRVDPMIALRSE